MTMMNITEVEDLKVRLLAAGTPRPEIIRQLAEATLGWPYVFGAWGEPCTPSQRKKWYNLNPSHETIITKCPALNSGKPCSACKWGAGVRIYDCRGFTAWLVRQVGLDIAGSGATSQYRTAGNWAAQGPIAEMPDVVCCVFKDKNGTKEHTGMHVGGGRIIHCSSGVQTGKTSDKGWTHYAVPKGLYSEEEIPMTNATPPTLRQGQTGENVRRMQEILILLGYSCGKDGADGKFGTNTRNALTAFQTDALLDVDGVCGKKTWTELLKAEALLQGAGQAPAEPEKAETYRVTIEGLTYAQYREILEKYPLAWADKE